MGDGCFCLNGLGFDERVGASSCEEEQDEEDTEKAELSSLWKSPRCCYEDGCFFPFACSDSLIWFLQEIEDSRSI